MTEIEINTVNEFEYDEIIDNHRECNHSVKVLRWIDLCNYLVVRLNRLQNGNVRWLHAENEIKRLLVSLGIKQDVEDLD